jgi:hypothetical protein
MAKAFSWPTKRKDGGQLFGRKRRDATLRAAVGASQATEGAERGLGALGTFAPHAG